MLQDERDPLTHQVIGAAMEVHREMGPGLLESVYQRCLEREITRQGLKFIPQARLPLIYKRVFWNSVFSRQLRNPGKQVEHFS